MDQSSVQTPQNRTLYNTSFNAKDMNKTMIMGSSFAVINPHISYNLPGLYDNLNSTSGLEHGNLPSPAKYEQKSQFSPQNQSNSFSFGLAKENMKKIHIQVIEKLAPDGLPGPGHYVPPPTFGKLGPQYTLSPKSQLRELELFKSGYLPGPGFYQQPDLVGPELTTKLTSNIISPRTTKFPQAKDRFRVPTEQIKAPGPGQYTPKDRLSEDNRSIYRSVGRAVFGKDERKALEDKYQMHVEKPGPGTYEMPTEFGRYEPPSLLRGSRFNSSKRGSERGTNN
ncbi:UNKNOWN [Stylonychia lemnae]|uniref:Uncharacterized protein n=1 Tax=Stylonychia lemnae TaxID=5949 RepID=A0A078ADZ2_STYLE|nr:UNKNOWN [Stylonychia lemnae]|eukprot:CDW80439.1 UNKNOWN [Stylonychia lemnae]